MIENHPRRRRPWGRRPSADSSSTTPAAAVDLKNWNADFVKVDQATLFDNICLLKIRSPGDFAVKDDFSAAEVSVFIYFCKEELPSKHHIYVGVVFSSRPVRMPTQVLTITTRKPHVEKRLLLVCPKLLRAGRVDACGCGEDESRQIGMMLIHHACCVGIGTFLIHHACCASICSWQ